MLIVFLGIICGMETDYYHIFYLIYINSVISFDMPLLQFQNFPFESRYEMLVNGIDGNNPICVSLNYIIYCLLFLFENKENVAMRIKCSSSKQVKKMMENILSEGGEGVVLRKSGSLYSQGRSPSLLKLKVLNNFLIVFLYVYFCPYSLYI